MIKTPNFFLSKILKLNYYKFRKIKKLKLETLKTSRSCCRWLSSLRASSAPKTATSPKRSITSTPPREISRHFTTKRRERSWATCTWWRPTSAYWTCSVACSSPLELPPYTLTWSPAWTDCAPWRYRSSELFTSL